MSTAFNLLASSSCSVVVTAGLHVGLLSSGVRMVLPARRRQATCASGCVGELGG